MSPPRWNRIALGAATTLSLVALACVASGYFLTPQTDEGSAAHIFQVCVALLVPAGLVWVATADWSDPARSARALALPAAPLAAAFIALFFLEHYR